MSTTSNKRAGRKPFEIPADTKINWKQPNGVIAKQLDTTILTVMKLRTRLGIPALPKGRPITEQKWEQAEFNLSSVGDGETQQISEQIQQLIDILTK